jgi:endonuclease YncB( thermonuclease family)
MTARTSRFAWLLATIALIAATLAAPAAAQTATPGDPGFETNGALPWEEPPGALEFIVWEVNDGDTIRVIEPDQRNDPDPYWEPVRIIGIDTPEKDGPYTDEECYGQEASAFAASLMPRGTVVYLQVDNDPDIPDDREFLDTGMELDDNDRWLVHVYIKAEDSEDYYLVSEIMALGGYAEVPGYEGNTYFERELADAEDIAREDDLGIWGAC